MTTLNTRTVRLEHALQIRLGIEGKAFRLSMRDEVVTALFRACDSPERTVRARDYVDGLALRGGDRR